MLLEECRTKEELVNCFKQAGKEITEEEIQALKGSYKQIKENKNNLNLKQLESVAGGFLEKLKSFFRVNGQTPKYVPMSLFPPEDGNHKTQTVILSGKEACEGLGKYLSELQINELPTNGEANTEHDFRNFIVGVFAACATLYVSGLIINSPADNSFSNENDKNGEILC